MGTGTVVLSLGLQNCFSYLDSFANLFGFCCNWRQLLHLISPSVRIHWMNPVDWDASEGVLQPKDYIDKWRILL